MLLEAWREAGRHTPVADVVQRLAPLLGEEIEADTLLVWRLDAERQRMHALAVAAPGRPVPPRVDRADLSPSEVEELRVWGRRHAVARGAGAAPAPLLGRGEAGRDLLVSPLTDGDGEDVLGFAVALGRAGAFEDAGRRTLWSQLREPLAAVVRNDLQRNEIARYREALEADRQALLSRLGRQEITDAIVGSDAGLRPVMDRVVQVAKTDVPVLLLGETGTGKEVVAREIHRLSARAKGPVVRINCGAVPPGLIDSELFGHERGSFTGAVSDRAGWFERADGGTLFLDEIGELPLEAQVRLLRVLQDGTFERVGGRRTRSADVRIIAATHRDLRTMVADGRFREDLWYRISVFPIRLPPLRERPGDIPALAEHFAWRAGKRLGGSPLTPSAADLELLIDYPWPGNVREVAAVIERAVILGGGHRLEIAAALGIHPAPRALPPPAERSADPEPFPTLEEAIRRHVEDALRRTGGRIEGPSGAARLLDVNPHTLRARMRKLGLDWARFRGAGAIGVLAE